MADVRERARRERIRFLLRTRNDAYPTPRARATPYTQAGPGRAEDLKKVKCPGCAGTGKTRLRQKCGVCDGEKRIPVDGYVGRVSSGKHTIQRHMTPESTEAEISRLKTSLALSEGKADPQESYGWERARERQLRSGSYKELEQALEVLRDRKPVSWAFLMWVYGPLEPEQDRYSIVTEDRVIGELSKLMPRQIRIPRHEHERLKRERIEKAREMAKAGESLPAISQVVLIPEIVLEDLLRV